MVFFGLNLTPMGWLMVLVGVAFALLLPFGLIGSITAPLPEPFRTIADAVLGYFGFPILLCYLHSRKLFGRGIGSAFFKIYMWFYLLIGVAAMVGTSFAEGGFNASGFIIGVSITAVGIGMIWWSRRTTAAFQSAVDEETIAQEDKAREEEIQRQAEAILRAEEMKRERDGA